MTTQTRGERNHNPGNIIYSPHIPYKGMLGLEIVPDGESYNPVFARFDTDENGIRAVAVCFLAYVNHHGLNTIRGLVTRWSLTDQFAYIKNVACWFFGVDPSTTSQQMIDSYADRVLVMHSTTTLSDLIPCFIRQENGHCNYDHSLIVKAVEDAEQTAG